ncbi:MAG TPA: PAS domain-containing sensor histidine kinase, partial [Cyclobacteriaceae bacterium]
MSEGILMVDENGIIITANPVAEDMFGYEKNALANVELETLLPVRYRGGHVAMRKSFNDHPEPRRMGVGRDLAALKKDGKEFPVEISLSYTRLKGQLLAMAFISDISERKKAEEGLKRSEEQLIVYAAELEKKVEARTEALHSTIQELEKEIHDRKKAEEESRKALEKERELNDLKSKFVSIASHEFRTPLSTILSSISLVDKYKERNDLEKIDKHTQRVRSSVNHLTGILNDFLSLGKLEEGKIDVVNESVHLTHLFNDIIEELKPGLKEDQKIILENNYALEEIVTDARVIRNILFNLLSNASKYSNAGKNIYLTWEGNANQLIIHIRDEGIGIPPEDHKHLFDRFFRASNVSNIQGTGLGLHIVRRYLDLLNGSIN